MIDENYSWSIYRYPPPFLIYLARKIHYVLGTVLILSLLSYFLIDPIVAMVIGFFSFLGANITLFFMYQVMSGKNIIYLIDKKGVTVNNVLIIDYDKLDKTTLLNKIHSAQLPYEKWEQEELKKDQIVLKLAKANLEFPNQKSRQQAFVILAKYLSQ